MLNMLIFSYNKLLPANINMLVLADKFGGYYYVHRSLFEQAVIIEDRYKNNVEALLKALGIESVEELPSNVNKFVENAPRPLNMLGYFLTLIDDFNDTDESMDVLCGSIHVMSSVLNFREFLRIPREARAGISFSLSIREEYELSWDRFFQEALPYAALSNYTQSASVSNNQVREEYHASTSESSHVTLEEAETDEDFLELFDEDLDLDLDFSTPVEMEEIPVVEEPVQEEPKAPKTKSGLSLLGGM